MKFKITHAQFLALQMIIEKAVVNANPSNIEAKLIYYELKEIQVIMRQKTAREKALYNIGLSDAQSIVLYIFLINSPVVHLQPYEQNLIRIITNSIHKKYA
jgi:hypothetical protein